MSDAEHLSGPDRAASARPQPVNPADTQDDDPGAGSEPGLGAAPTRANAGAMGSAPVPGAPNSTDSPVPDPGSGSAAPATENSPASPALDPALLDPAPDQASSPNAPTSGSRAGARTAEGDEGFQGSQWRTGAVLLLPLVITAVLILVVYAVLHIADRPVRGSGDAHGDIVERN